MELASELIRTQPTSPSRAKISLQIAAKWLEMRGVPVTLKEERGVEALVAYVGGGEKTIVLNGHLDVVPGRTEQFLPEVREGRLYGRGSYDMLGAVAAMMHVVAHLTQNPPWCRVVLMLVPDEETAGRGTKMLVRRGYVGDFVICGEPSNLGIGVQAKGILQLAVRVQGVAAHGSRPWLGDNAILKAVELYRGIENLPFAGETSPFFSGPSINLAKIRGGRVYNQVPPDCYMGVDIRFLPGQNSQEILRQIRSLSGPNRVRVISRSPAVQTSPDNPYVLQLTKTVASVTGYEPRLFGQDGAADTRYFSQHGIPAVEFGPAGANHHGDDEYVDIGSLETFMKILTLYIRDFPGVETKAAR